MAGLRPRLRGGTYAFLSVPPDTDLTGLNVVATMREDEGLTLVVPVGEAEARGHEIGLRAAWITLTADTALDAVGITATFARALADAGIACNVIAGTHHDHVFVPVAAAQRAVEVLAAVEPGAD